MNIKIKATKIELTPAIKNYVDKKMDMLGKYLENLPVIHFEIEVGKTSDHHQKGDIFRCEANLDLGKSMLRVEKTEKDLYKAVDKVKDHLARSIVKYKEKTKGK